MIEIELVGGPSDGEEKVLPNKDFSPWIALSELISKNYDAGTASYIRRRYNLDEKSITGRKAKYVLDDSETKIVVRKIEEINKR